MQDDAISREKALNIACQCGIWAYRAIEKLPSVTPKPIECDDAISREAVIKILEKYNLEMSKIAEDVSELPSVTQSITRDIEKSNFSQDQYLLDTDSAYQIGYEQGHKDAEQKSGKWIDKEISNPDYPFQDRKIIECSKCHYGIVQARLGYTNYCPNCGAKMKSEDKECTKKI